MRMIDHAYDPKATTVPVLRYLVAVADHGHFGRAARSCGVAQPTLSAQVRDWEKRMGVIVFERDRRGARVTAAGTPLIAAARRALQAVAELEAGAAGADALSGRVLCGLIPTVVDSLLPPALRAFSISFPEMNLNIVEDLTPRLVEMMEHGQLDCALFARTPATAGLVFHSLGFEAFHLAVPEGHELAHRDEVTSAELKGLPLILLGEGHCFRDQVLDLCRGARAQDHRVATLDALARLVAAGAGCTLLPAGWCKDGVPGCRVVPVASTAARRELGMAWRRGDHREEEFQAMASAVERVIEDRPLA